MALPRYITDIDRITQIPEEEREKLKAITDKFVFRVNEYYLSLIDWEDPNDPIKKLVIPNENELEDYGRWDASDEDTNYVVPGCQHKYRTTALLICSEVCGAYCRYCFRKRLFRNDVKEAMIDVEPGLNYIAEHPEINNVLLTGGDPLILAAKKLDSILGRLREMDHVKIIRLGSKLPAFNPMRIYEDEDLLNVIRKHSTPEKRIYVMAHINHPREITDEAYKAFQALHDAGAIVVNQTPVVKGINDDEDVIVDVLDKTSGLGKRVRLSMSHTAGKVEILAIENGKAYLKFHQSRDDEYGKFMVLDCPKDAAWFDDLPGNEVYWKQPEKKVEEVVSVNEMDDMPKQRQRRRRTRVQS